MSLGHAGEDAKVPLPSNPPVEVGGERVTFHSVTFLFCPFRPILSLKNSSESLFRKRFLSSSGVNTLYFFSIKFIIL